MTSYNYRTIDKKGYVSDMDLNNLNNAILSNNFFSKADSYLDPVYPDVLTCSLTIDYINYRKKTVIWNKSVIELDNIKSEIMQILNSL